MYCTKCGGYNKDDYKFCRHCGAKRSDAPVHPPSPPTPPPGPAYSPPPPEPGPLYPPSPPFLPLSEQPTYYPPVQVPAAASFPSAPEKSRRTRLPFLLTIGAGTIALCLLVSGALAIFLFSPDWLPTLNPGKHLVYGVPAEDHSVDLYLAEYGKEQEDSELLADNIKLAQTWLSMIPGQKATRDLTRLPFNFAAFVPRKNSLLFWQKSNGGVALYRSDADKSNVDLLLETDDPYLRAVFHSANDRLIFISSLQTQMHCYRSRSFKAASQLASGDFCTASRNGDYLLSFTTKDNRTLLSVIDAGSSDEILNIDSEDFISLPIISDDGKLIAYVKTEENDSTVLIVSTSENEILAESEPFRKIIDIGFSPDNKTLYVIAKDQAGEVQLHLLNSKTSQRIASGGEMIARFSQDGKSLIFRETTAENELALYAYQIDKDEQLEIIRAKGITFSLPESMQRLVIYQYADNETRIMTAASNGENLIEILNQPGAALSRIYQTDRKDRISILLTNDDGSKSLYVSKIDADDGFYLVENWHQFLPLNLTPNMDQYIFVGAPESDDHLALYSVRAKEGSEPVLLDDTAKNFINAVPSPDRSSVVYTAQINDSPLGYEIRLVKLNGDDPYETLYSQAYLVDTQWLDLQPFQTMQFELP